MPQSYQIMHIHPSCKTKESS